MYKCKCSYWFSFGSDDRRNGQSGILLFFKKKKKTLFVVFVSRSAKEAEDKIKKALDKGEVLPTEARFDSNCITPGMFDLKFCTLWTC